MANTETEAWQAARDGQKVLCEKIYQDSGRNMLILCQILMGATAVRPAQKEIAQFALENGAPLLWAIDQSQTLTAPKMGSFYGKRITMKDGPGEVPRGSFQH